MQTQKPADGKLHARAKPYPVPQLEHINPDLAKKYLASQVNNRRITPNRVIDFALDMEEKKWSVNGESLKFNHTGNLIDGQHRLEACILAQTPFWSWVIREIDDPRAFATIDVGKTRTHGDIFSIAGIASYAIGSVSALILYHWKEGHLKSLPGPTGFDRTRVRRIIKGSKYSKGNAGGANRVPKETLLAFMRPYEHKIVEAISKVGKLRANKVMTMGLAVALYVLFEEKDPIMAHAFFRDLCSGEDLKQNDPVYVVREKLIEHRRSAAKMSRWVIMLLCIKAWNARRDNEKVRFFRVANDEKFPKIK